jgi:FkbM family methyltransferase
MVFNGIYLMSGMGKVVLLVRAVTSHLPRIKGVGVILALIANYFKKRSRTDIELSVFGRRMLLNPSDAISNVLIFTPQWYDYKERKFLRRVVQKGDYIVDIGANIGAYTLIFADLVGLSGAVTAIEAEKTNAQRLTHNVFLNGIDWVRICNSGVSDKVESLPLLLNLEGNAGAHSFFRQPNKSDALFQKIECKPLVSLIDNRRAKLFKLDIEGFEWRVLRKYFEDVSDSLWPEYILLEDDPRNREDDAVSLCLNHGYRVLKRIDYNVFLKR